MMQAENVQKWVNSLPVENGEDMHENNIAENGHLLQSSSNNRVSDDMSLGAEAKSVMLTGDGRLAASAEEFIQDSELTNSVVGAGTKFRLLSGACNEGRDAAVKLLRQRFRLQQQDSFNSEASSHLTIDSIDQLLWERQGNPEQILENLGFVGKIVDRRHRIPERFLRHSSKANGISVDDFLEKNLWLKEYLDQKAALRKPFEAITLDTNDDSVEPPTEIENVTNKKMNAFHQVASTITMINRFRTLVRRLNAREPNLEPLVEPTLRKGSRGTKYWSILSLDNYDFLDKMGYYNMHLERPSKTNRSKFSVAASTIMKQVSGNSLENVSQNATVNDLYDNKPHLKQSDKLDKILHSRSPIPTEKEKENMEKVPEKVEPPGLKGACFSVPERFLTSQSLLFGPVQQVTGEYVSELVRKGGDSSFNLPNTSDLCFASSGNVALTDLNANTIEDLPKIAFGAMHDSVSSRSKESFDYEWQRNSVSSTGTDYSSFSDSDDRAIFFDICDNPRMDALGLTIDDVDRDFLRIPSDVASNLSSHTLREHENLDHSSDQDACTDTLQASQDSQSLRDDVGIDRFNSSDERDQQRNIHEVSSQSSKKTGEAVDHLPPVINFPLKIRGVLRRQGSSQSDSSGFVDSDHLDSSLLPESYFPNKVRYMNRQMKLGTISSQDSNAMEEDSNFSSQSDIFHSPESVLSTSADQNSDIHSKNQMRILKSDYRNELWLTKHSVETQTVWNDFHDDTEEFLRSPYEFKTDNKILMKEKFLGQSEMYTTHLYIDSLPQRTSIPLVEKAEVMLILDGSGNSCKSQVNYNDSRMESTMYHVSSVDVNVLETKDGDQVLAPVLFSSGKSATVKNQMFVDERHLSRHRQQTTTLNAADEEDDLDNPVLSLANASDSSLKLNLRERKSLPSDFSDHQILHSLLKQSVFVSPQCAATLLPPSQWSTLGNAEISQKQHLLEEVKLLQHALQKYRLEVRVLQMQAKKLYVNERSCILSGKRDSLIAVEELHEAISKELDDLDTQLSQRMKSVILVSPHELSLGVDLSCLSIIKQMTELLKEQTYHGNIISGMSTILPMSRRSASATAAYVRNSEEDLLLEKITALEKKMEEQTTAFEKCLTNSMRQMQEIMQNNGKS